MSTESGDALEPQRQVPTMLQPARISARRTVERLLRPPIRPIALAGAACLIALGLAEGLVVYADPRAGITAHIVSLVVILACASAAREPALQKLLIGFSLPPLVRITSFSLPLQQIPSLYWYLLAAVPMFAGAFTVVRLSGLSKTDMGLSLSLSRAPAQIAIGITGLAFGIIEYVILQPEPLAAEVSLQALWVPVVVLIVGTGFAEEFTFRGVMQPIAVGSLGNTGIFYTALAFAILHLGYRSVPDFGFVLVVGLFFGWAVLRTRSILGVTISHSLTNVMLFLLVPLLLGRGTGGA